MDAERWRLIAELYNSALGIAADERADFLRRHCGDDDALRFEVESLLVAHDEAGDFLAAPAVENAAERIFVRQEIEDQPTQQPAGRRAH